MKLESHLPRQSPWLYIAPLLTAVLLIMVYFLLSSGFVEQSGISIRLPESPARLVGFEMARIVTIAPGSPARLFLDGHPVSMDQLTEKLASQDQRDRRAVIYADRSVPFGQITEVSQAILAQHFEVAYATTRPTVGGQP
jgi:biopolymer transport protein ExbD